MILIEEKSKKVLKYIKKEYLSRELNKVYGEFEDEDFIIIGNKVFLKRKFDIFLFYYTPSIFDIFSWYKNA